jgi:hypothetical protein
VGSTGRWTAQNFLLGHSNLTEDLCNFKKEPSKYPPIKNISELAIILSDAVFSVSGIYFEEL